MKLITLNESTLLEAALTYAKLGWPVLPLVPKKKHPITENGLKDASINPSKITEWWSRWPKANIGVRTGFVFDVLDLDGEAGISAFAKGHPEYVHRGPISDTGGGYHMLFKVTGSKNHAHMWGEPIDFRGEGGYIVAAPSTHPLGHQYRWIRESESLPVAPAWLRAVLFQPKLVRTTDRNDPALQEALEKAGDLRDVFSSMGRTIVPAGGDFLGRLSCPFHQGDNDPSLYIYPNNTFNCFGCGAWGDALNVKKWIRTGKLRDRDHG